MWPLHKLFLLWSSLQKHSPTHTCLVHICSWTKQNSPTVPSLYYNPPLTLIPIILLVSMPLCVTVISSLFHPPHPPLFHSSITQDALPSWKHASQHGKGQSRGGQVSAGGDTEDVCVILLLTTGLNVVHPEETRLASSWLSLWPTRAAIRTWMTH